MKVLDVQYHGFGKPLQMGRIACNKDIRKDPRIFFEMDPDFMRYGVNPSPFALKIRTGLQVGPKKPFNGLHGLFADSLPDSWGMRLLARAFRRGGMDPDEQTPVDLLAFVGSEAMGALSYHPQKGFGDFFEKNMSSDEIDLMEVGEQATIEYEAAESNETSHPDVGQPASVLLGRLLHNAASPGGARPKVLVGMNDEGHAVFEAKGEKLPGGYSHWIAKFPVGNTPEKRCAGAVEYLYSEMAKSAGINMSECRLIPAKDGHAYFATKRFDREPCGCRYHVHTVSGLMGEAPNTEKVDYMDILKLCSLLTRSHSEKLEMFRRMVFNVVSGNRDDHTKNFAFMLKHKKKNRNGKPKESAWVNTPAYDLTFCKWYGTTVQGRREDLTGKDFLDMAEKISIPQQVARETVEKVCDAISKWQTESINLNIPDETCENIWLYMSKMRKKIGRIAKPPQSPKFVATQKVAIRPQQ